MPAAHPSPHFWWTLALVGVSFALMAIVRNHLIRRRLLFTAGLALGAAALHVVMLQWPATDLIGRYGLPLEKLILAFAWINAFVALLFNPWFQDRVAERAPAIVQDAFVAVLVAVAVVLMFRMSTFNFLAGSTIVAAIVGFALQETLGNAFAGMAIQIEKPFRVGHWITVGSHEGEVAEVTWRATKIRTKAGNLVIVPNNVVAREAINNYSQPIAPTRLAVEVGVGYQVPPNAARDAILVALGQARRVLREPAPQALLWDFGASALIFRVYFWIDNYAFEEEARDEVRRAIYYEFHRRGIEIPWPIQIEYQRVEQPADTASQRAEIQQVIAGAPVFASLPAEAHAALASSAANRLFGDGQIIVREGEPGQSMFVVRQGSVGVGVGTPPRDVAAIDAGGYFGEMSLLTGEPRTATVYARGDCTVLEIAGSAFRAYVQSRPDVIDELARAALSRRQELDKTRAALGAGIQAHVSLAERMRRFFGLQ